MTTPYLLERINGYPDVLITLNPLRLTKYLALVFYFLVEKDDGLLLRRADTLTTSGIKAKQSVRLELSSILVVAMMEMDTEETMKALRSVKVTKL
ncbi:hypothetical protein PQX77_022263 [Marasmius sp. AFHP31]|nr:hypothetical protein PQX77_022263 [Marasmius sp. AFHP31]